MKFILTISIFLLIGGFSQGVQESVSHNFDRSIFKNVQNKNAREWLKVSAPEKSYLNKWKDRNGDPSTRKEAFPLSSTILVFVTDMYHCAKFVAMMMMFSVVIIFSRMYFYQRSLRLINLMIHPYKSAIPLFSMYAIWNIGFYLSYSLIPNLF